MVLIIIVWRDLVMKLIAALCGSLGTFFSLVAVIGAFAWLARKASVLMRAVR